MPTAARTAALCALAILIAAPPAAAIPPLPHPPEPEPGPNVCRAMGFIETPHHHGYYGSARTGQAMPMMAPPPSPPPPPPPHAIVRSPQSVVVTGQKRADVLLSKPAVGYAPSPYPYGPPPGYVNRDRYEDVAANPIRQVAAEPVSTFSIDVDTASYANVRRYLMDGQKPPADAVRVEEMINYFDYDYEHPTADAAPFRTHLAVVPSPWNTDRQIVHIGLQGYNIDRAQQPPLNLVFLIDTSGSMGPEDRLPLAKKALDVLIGELKPNDRVSMVAYAGSAGAVLGPTPGSDKVRMRCALRALHSGGSTAGGEGLALAYALAEQNFRKGAVNRVILLTDGDFNVGINDPEKLEDFVAGKRKSGIYLSVYGFGRGNYHDVMMQTLAQSGNGTAAYIDSLDEGRKVFREDFTSSLFPIADDVKIQVEFNPRVVREYRLIGYETRMLNREDFNNDQVDAGEVGSGASVTALYEVALVGSPSSNDDLRYQPSRTPGDRLRPEVAAEYAHVKVRYKAPGAANSVLLSQPISYHYVYTPETAPESTRFAMAVAAFGQKLRGDPWLNADYGWDDIERLARGAQGTDEFGRRAEFLRLVRAARDGRSVNE
ncbi:MAG TPA: VWA domain-containing protein [Caulobacteraceae bacterium]|nr:VWA domain-containing protein [Caulobacteraceae bacterium]